MRDSDDLSGLLQQAHDALEAMWNAPDGPHRPEHAFMSRFFQLALMLEREPLLRSEPRVQRFLEASRAKLEWAELPIEAYAGELEAALAQPWDIGSETSLFIIDRWAEVCRSRSALQFLIQHFPTLPFLVPGREVRETLRRVDERLRAKIERGEAKPHPEQVPPGIPDSHPWWRWLPLTSQQETIL